MRATTASSDPDDGISSIVNGSFGARKQDRGTWPAISDLLGAVVSSSYYEIRVAGVLPPEALLDFERLTASVEPVETVVHGPIRDQAALQGLLARLETFGIRVLEIRLLRAGEAVAATEEGQQGQQGQQKGQ
jgi:hypothetical protein